MKHECPSHHHWPISDLAMILGELESHDVKERRAHHFELLDVHGIDIESIRSLTEVTNRAEVVFQWVQGHIVNMIQTEVLNIPSPLLTRVFQDLGNGMAKYHLGLRFPDVPVPYPYIAVAEMTLYAHAIMTPIVSIQWCATPLLPPFLTFVLVFTLWSLFIVSGELENPHGGGEMNDLDVELVQAKVNAQLMTLVQGPSMRLPDLAHSPEDSSRRLSVQLSNFDKATYCQTRTRDNGGSAWGNVVDGLPAEAWSSEMSEQCATGQ